MTRLWIWLLPLSSALALQLAAGKPGPFVPGLGPPPPSWWWVSTAVAVATAFGAFRLMRGLGLEGALLPAALVIGAASMAGPLAARAADGPSGAGFGMEPLALCLLIWCYDAVIRTRSARAGLLLGAAGLAHPLALAHGLAVVTIATLLTGDGPWRRLGLTVAIALAAGAPAAVQLAIGIGDIVGMDAGAAARLVEEGYRFRYPNSYTLSGLLWDEGMSRVLLVLAGLAGAVSLLDPARNAAARALAGVVAGHAMLAALAVLCYTRRVPGPWTRWVTPHALDLTLTSPLLPLVCGVAAMAALEARVTRGRQGIAGPNLLRLGLWAGAATLLVTLHWKGAYLVAVALGLMALVVMRTGRGRRIAALALAASALGAGAWGALRRQSGHPPLDRAESELYQWARGTPKRTSFIVPPTARAFRYHTRKGVYVDYDLVPPASPRAMRMWRDRLDLIARPDARLATVPVWRRPYAMDRAYAVANTPARAAELLSQLGEDYLVWDVRGLDIPPYLPVHRPPDPRVVEAFRNERYVVYALAEGRRVSR